VEFWKKKIYTSIFFQKNFSKFPKFVGVNTQFRPGK